MWKPMKQCNWNLDYNLLFFLDCLEYLLQECEGAKGELLLSHITVSGYSKLLRAGCLYVNRSLVLGTEIPYITQFLSFLLVFSFTNHFWRKYALVFD